MLDLTGVRSLRSHPWALRAREVFTVYFPGLLEIPNSIHIQIQQIFL